jgi:hypothetical protein
VVLRTLARLGLPSCFVLNLSRYGSLFRLYKSCLQC